MDWANDQLGRLVHAADRHLFGYGFTCRTCGERVRLRAGSERRPHFAHYSHSPKTDCENYYPSAYQGPAVGFRHGDEEYLSSSFSFVSLAGGVFLEREEGSRFALYLKLPRIKSNLEATGEIHLQSGLGVRVFSAHQLHRSQIVRVKPQVPLVEVSAVDDMRGAIAAIKQDISLFRSTGNVFRAGAEPGRLLMWDEPLEWGESYRILTQHQLSPPPFELPCELVAQGGPRAWFLYEITLPLAPLPESAVTSLLSRYLSRTLRPPASRLYLVDPPPHHVEPDGTHIYPLPPTRLLLRRTAPGSVEVEGTAYGAEGEVREQGVNWIEIHGLNRGEARISSDAGAQINLRVDDCDLFRPKGVRLSTGNDEWDLFADTLKDALANNIEENITIQAPTSRIADLVGFDTPPLNRWGSQITLRSGIVRPSIDASNFGGIKWREEVPRLATHIKAAAPEQFAKRSWLEALVTRVAGQEALKQLQQFWLNRDLKKLHAFEGTNAWLRPYIYHALGMEEPTNDLRRDR